MHSAGRIHINAENLQKFKLSNLNQSGMVLTQIFSPDQNITILSEIEPPEASGKVAKSLVFNGNWIHIIINYSTTKTLIKILICTNCRSDLGLQNAPSLGSGCLLCVKLRAYIFNLFALEPRVHTRLFIRSIMTMISTASCEFSTVLQSAGGIFIFQSIPIWSIWNRPVSSAAKPPDRYRKVAHRVGQSHNAFW